MFGSIMRLLTVYISDDEKDDRNERGNNRLLLK